MKRNIDDGPKKYFYPEAVEDNPTNNNLYHDLPGHLNALLKEIPDEKDKEKIIQNINTYYDTLNALMFKQSMEYPRMSNTDNILEI